MTMTLRRRQPLLWTAAAAAPAKGSNQMPGWQGRTDPMESPDVAAPWFLAPEVMMMTTMTFGSVVANYARQER